MSAADRLNPQRLIEHACESAGTDDFGDDDSWRDGYARVIDGFINDARLSELGVEIAAADVMRALTNRLQITRWRSQHPEVADEKISQPVVIVGQPRTGTTILYDLLAQDPALRPPLTWEVDMPVPVPKPDTYHIDSRIAESQASIDLAEQFMPGFQAFHPMGALVGQECVRITAGQFCSMIFSVQYRMPDYYRWLLYDADHRGAYRYHRKFLQHLQSGVPGQWLLKSPAHLWQLEALMQEYPDALIVETHRDPLNVISSISFLARHLRRMASAEPSLREAADQHREEIIVGLEREMKMRDCGVIPPGQVVDVRFADFVRDPFATIRRLYGKLDRELTPGAEQKMRDHLAAHPGDGGGSRYTWADTGLDAGVVREQVAAYQERYDVPTEPLK